MSISPSSSDFYLDEDDHEVLRRDDDTGGGDHLSGTTSTESPNQAVAEELQYLDLDDDDPLQLDEDDPSPVTVAGAGGGAAATIGLKTVEAPDDGSDCPICMDGGGGERKDAWVETPCAHRFHERCLDTWAQVKSGTCPICRRVLTTTTAAAAATDLTAAMDFSANYYAQLLSPLINGQFLL